MTILTIILVLIYGVLLFMAGFFIGQDLRKIEKQAEYILGQKKKAITIEPYDLEKDQKEKLEAEAKARELHPFSGI